MNTSDENFEQPYEEKVAHLIDTLYFNKLAVIKRKDLKELSDEDLEFIGFNRIKDDEIENLYCYEDLDHIKVYINRVGNKFELRVYRLMKLKDINTTTELLDETLTKWKLKM